MYEELVKRLWECASGECFNCSQYTETTNASVCSKELMKQAANAIEELTDRNVGKWIPVTERLPEKEDEAVIVWEKQGFALIDWRHDNKWAILDNNYGIATHWMPLPEPPKEE